MSDFSKAINEMIEGQLRTSGVFDARILSAFAKVPRHAFLTSGQIALAYSDKDHQLSKNPFRFMAAATPLAKLIQLGDPGPNDVVLDIACANGYSSAILAHLASSVVGVESDSGLVNQANDILSRLDIPNAAVIKGELKEGAGSEAPFDVIIIGGSVDEVPQKLLDQLRIGGKLAALVGSGASATAVLHTKNQTGVARVSSFNACLPVLGEFAKPHQFTL